MRRSAYDRKQGWYRGKQAFSPLLAIASNAWLNVGGKAFLFASAGASFYELDFRREH